MTLIITSSKNLLSQIQKQHQNDPQSQITVDIPPGFSGSETLLADIREKSKFPIAEMRIESNKLLILPKSGIRSETFTG